MYLLRDEILKKIEKWLLVVINSTLFAFYEYLGVIMSSSGLWYLALAAQASKAMIAVMSQLAKLGDLLVKTKFKSF